MKNFYIAFSIHGTNTFIVATLPAKERSASVDLAAGTELQIGADTFSVAQSRRPEALANPSDCDVKLHDPRLVTKVGAPLRCPSRVVGVFKKLAAAGWTVDDARFREYHKMLRSSSN